MSKSYLVIVESPGKIKKLKHILGADYEFIASMGHVVDLPPTEFGIELDTMQPRYVVLKNDVAKRLRTEAQQPYKVIYLASDPDREGEAISHHVAELLQRTKGKSAWQLQRVTFDAITPSAVKAAFNSPRALDQDLIAAQEARRLLDRLVGFPASRFLWQFISGKGISAGRVQSAALRLVVEREEAVQAFVPQEYWTITARFKAANGEFDAKLTQWQGAKPQLKSRADADAVLNALKGVEFHIQSVQPKQRQQKPPAPFITSSLQQAASSHLSSSPDTTMKLAQTLYEQGYITYMRTDSPAVSPEGAKMAADYVRQTYGDSYLGTATYKASASAQEAHECIRPTDLSVTPDMVRVALGAAGGRTADLYELIFKRFLASQMAAAVYDEVHVRVVGGAAVFSAKGSRLAFDGFLRVYAYVEERATSDSDDEDEPHNTQLPQLKVGELVNVLRYIPQQHFTQPPPFYSEALLVKALEQHGVGRPSTYAQTVTTLKQRNYVEVRQRKLHPTALGKQVHQVLSSKLPNLFEVTFTAQMETNLDEIAVGKRDSKIYLKTFWSQVSPLFGEKVVTATVSARTSGHKSPPKTRRTTVKKASVPKTEATSGQICPRCGKPLVLRHSARGAFWGCSGFPKCRFTRDAPDEKPS